MARSALTPRRSLYPAPLLLALALLLASGAPGRAQDDDPASVLIREQGAVRARQMTQVTGAYARASEPLHRTSGATSDSTLAGAQPLPAPGDRRLRWGRWTLGALGVLAAAASVRAFRGVWQRAAR